MAISKRNLILFQSSESGIELYDELANYEWNVYIANTIQQVSGLLEQNTFHVGLCLLDTYNKTGGWSSLNQLFNSHSNIKWIMGLSEDASPHRTSNSIESKLIADYCFDYVTLPIDIKRLVFTLGHAQGMNKISNPTAIPGVDYSSNFGLIGDSPAMVSLFKLLQKVANEDCSVLIQGETGTGKELIANAIHLHSYRSEQPLIAINCGAFPKELIQSELFGHEKGSFTGAQQRKIGRIEAAEGGTLFLDEIGDLPLDQQVNLLRFLEDRTIRRIGGSENIPVNVRIIAATHIDLKAAVQNKTFREDLYYRLQVLQIETPPLRLRGKDIESLAWHFFNTFSENNQYTAKGLQAESINLLNNYDWPGNVRELMNCIRHAIVTSENDLLTPEDLGIELSYKYSNPQSLNEGRAIAETNLIMASLRHTSNNVSRAAEMLGISRVSLYRLIEKHGLTVTILLLMAIIPVTMKYRLAIPADDYFTLSSSKQEMPTGPKLRIVFSKLMPDAELKILIDKINGRVLEGQNKVGAYTIGLNADINSPDLTAIITYLRSREDVMLAEPVMQP